MKVNYYAVQKYLSWLTGGRAASNPDTIDEWETYEADMDAMIDEARKNGDEDLLRLSIDSLVASPEGRIDEFAGQVYGYSDDDLVDLFTYAFEYIWPDHAMSAPGYGPDFEFVPMSDEEWAARQGG